MPDQGHEDEKDGNPAEMTCQQHCQRTRRRQVPESSHGPGGAGEWTRWPSWPRSRWRSLAGASTAAAQGRVPRIRQRGTLVCGVAPGVAGFARVDDRGRYSGLDVDVCRAVAAAIFGTPDNVRYEHASSVEQFQRTPDIDLVSRRLTWSLQREGMGLLFGPVMFYDGQGFLVPGQARRAEGPSTVECPHLRRRRRLERVQSDDLLPVAQPHAAETY